MTTIGDDAFSNCPNLATITVSQYNTTYDSHDHCNAIIKTSSKTLAVGCKNTIIPDGVEIIENKAFKGCTGLTSITIPASVTSIGMNAFESCTSLASVTVYSSTPPTLGTNAFSGCDDDLQIYVYSDLEGTYQTSWSAYSGIITAIPNQSGTCGAAGNEDKVTWQLAITSTSGVLTISGAGAMADFSTINDQPWKDYRSFITSVVIEDGVTSIGYYAFYQCTGLTSIEIPASVKRIGKYAFYDCRLTSITLNEGLTTIGISAFSDNGTTIESVSIPESVTSIGDNAFNGTSVANFYINNIPSKIAIWDTPFKVDGVTIHVYTQMQSIFENAIKWSAYTGHFSEDIAITHVQSITLDNMIVKRNTSGKLNATINPADARVKDVVFTSSNDNIIRITDPFTGEFVAGSSEDEATITCTAMDGTGIYATCTVQVKSELTPAESLTLNMSENSLNVGEEFTLTAEIAPTDATYKNITWRTSDENVATVVNGHVTAVGQGVATITAISEDGQARANCVVTVVVASGTCGAGVTWTLTGTSPDYTLTISGTGAMANYSGGDQPWDSYRSGITSVVIEDGVTSIGDYAFMTCSGLTSITIPASVTSIGEFALGYCNLLTSVTFADESQLESIGNYAFASSGLTSIVIPASVTNIGEEAFDYCSNLATLTLLPATPPTLGGGAFNNIGRSVNSDKKFYFHGMEYGTNENPAWNDMYNHTGSFEGWTTTVIGTLTLSDGATTSTPAFVSDGTDDYYRQGTPITLGHDDPPTGYTFGYTVKDENGVDITSSAISGSTLTMPAGDVTVTAWKIISFEIEGVTYEWTSETTVKVAGCNSTSETLTLTIPASVESYNVTEIGEGAFEGKSNLTSIDMSNSPIIVIRTRAFKGCINLSSILLPASLTTIEDEAFEGCAIDNTLEIPDNVTYIGDRAFIGCDNLEALSLGSNVTYIGNEAFAGCSSLTVDLDDLLAKGTPFNENTFSNIGRLTGTLADNADNADKMVLLSQATANVMLKDRTLSKSGVWNTLCLPFDVVDGDDTDELTFTGTPLEGATVKELNTTTSNLAANGTLTLNFTEATAIEAGKPYIVKWTSGNNISNPVFTGVRINTAAPTAVTFTNNANAYGDCEFVGQYSPFTIGDGSEGEDGYLNEIIMLGSGSKLGYSQEARTLRCFRAHFRVPANGGAAARRFVMNFGDGETTGIVSMEDERWKMEDVNDAWYSIDGRKLNGEPTQKGVYINNGRKIVIK